MKFMMNYEETIQWMFAQLPMYQTQGAIAYKKDLSNVIKLATHLGNPERQIQTIHVAGTNGKGSTSSMLASVLQEAGYRVGLYTSPHLKDFRERIKIQGKMISESFIVDFITQNKTFFEAEQLSFFEMTVGLAFQYFAVQKVDIAVIEVGMGGRLDATNIINPLVSVITSIGKDHTAFLGDTLALIAGEKAGIIKQNVPVVIGEYHEETWPVFEQKAQSLNSNIYLASAHASINLASDLKGAYQKQNILTVCKTIDVLKGNSNFDISDLQLQSGLLQTVKNTGLQGRWQVLHQKPFVVCDCAHNKHGLESVLKQINETPKRELFFVLGFVNDKNLDEILPLFPKKAKYFLSNPQNPRGLEVSVLLKKTTEYGLDAFAFSSISEAYRFALKSASQFDMIYIGGSTFVVAEII
jgi:dihydrofolate synthase/folylpolyglutamate synthase